jgi:hypothetical protein
METIHGWQAEKRNFESVTGCSVWDLACWRNLRGFCDSGILGTVVAPQMVTIQNIDFSETSYFVRRVETEISTL